MSMERIRRWWHRQVYIESAADVILAVLVLFGFAALAVVLVSPVVALYLVAQHIGLGHVESLVVAIGLALLFYPNPRRAD